MRRQENQTRKRLLRDRVRRINLLYTLIEPAPPPIRAEQKASNNMTTKTVNRNPANEYWQRNQNTQALDLLSIAPHTAEENILGWVEPVIGRGGHIIAWTAGTPKEYDPETDTDAEHLGMFADLHLAMQAVETSNKKGIIV